MKKLDDSNAIKVAEDIWWVGFADYEAGFSNNPYLLVDEDEAILFDPGPGHPLFRDLVMQKIEQVTNPENIRYIVAHHQDPDLCGLIPFIENILHPDLVIMAHPRSAIFIPYYGTRKGILPLADGDALELRSGRRVTFYHAPYLHFAGNIFSYDEKTASLFSGDMFGVFDREWRLNADDSYLDLGKSFIEHYVASKEPVDYIREKISKLKIERILPQHGGIIEKNVDKFLDMLKDVEPGQLLRELKKKPTPEQEEDLLAAGAAWLASWLKRDVDAASLDDLMSIAMEEGPSTVSLLIDSMSKKAGEFGVSNPLTASRVHRWDKIWSSRTTQIIDSVRRRYLTRQYGFRPGEESDTHAVLQQGLQAFKTNVAAMFIDIRGFTKWSADKSPAQIMGMLDREFDMMARIINAGGGRVNKIMGDGMLAYFPEQKISNLMEAAIKIQEAIKELDLLPAGIGGDFGEVIMGDLGQEARLDYTIIGATVNFAARMCSSAGGGEIGVSAGLFEKLDARSKEAVAAAYTPTAIKVKIKPTDPEVEGVLLTRSDA